MPSSMLRNNKSEKILRETPFYRLSTETALVLNCSDKGQCCLLIDFSLSMPSAHPFLHVFTFFPVFTYLHLIYVHPLIFFFFCA